MNQVYEANDIKRVQQKITKLINETDEAMKYVDYYHHFLEVMEWQAVFGGFYARLTSLFSNPTNRDIASQIKRMACGCEHLDGELTKLERDWSVKYREILCQLIPNEVVEWKQRTRREMFEDETGGYKTMLLNLYNRFHNMNNDMQQAMNTVSDASYDSPRSMKSLISVEIDLLTVAFYQLISEIKHTYQYSDSKDFKETNLSLYDAKLMELELRWMNIEKHLYENKKEVKPINRAAEMKKILDLGKDLDEDVQKVVSNHMLTEHAEQLVNFQGRIVGMFAAMLLDFQAAKEKTDEEFMVCIEEFNTKCTKLKEGWEQLKAGIRA